LGRKKGGGRKNLLIIIPLSDKGEKKKSDTLSSPALSLGWPHGGGGEGEAILSSPRGLTSWTGPEPFWAGSGKGRKKCFARSLSSLLGGRGKGEGRWSRRQKDAAHLPLGPRSKKKEEKDTLRSPLFRKGGEGKKKVRVVWGLKEEGTVHSSSKRKKKIDVSGAQRQPLSIRLGRKKGKGRGHCQSPLTGEGKRGKKEGDHHFPHDVPL